MVGDDFDVAPIGAQKKYTQTELILAHAKELLRVVQCPNQYCFRGVILLDDRTAEDCQWCLDREKICG